MRGRLERISQFTNKYPQVKDFSEHKDICEEAIKELGYHRRTYWRQIAATLNKRGRGSTINRNEVPFSNNPIPKSQRTNNKKENRIPKTVASILARTNYQFNGPLIRRALGDEGYREFVEKYFITLQSRLHSEYWEPTMLERQVFKAYDEGEISFEEVRQALNVESNLKTKQLLGRIYAYNKEEQRRLKGLSGSASNFIPGEAGGSNQQSVSDSEAGQYSPTSEANSVQSGDDLLDLGGEDLSGGL